MNSIIVNSEFLHRPFHLQIRLKPLSKEIYKFKTYAGGGYGHLDGIGTIAKFRAPEGIAVDKNGNVYTTEYGSSIVRKITPDGIVSTLAGKDNALGFADGISNEARFNRPHGIAVDKFLNVYVADMKNCTIRKISPNGKVETVAGVPEVKGSSDGQSLKATFNQPEGIAVNSKGYIYVADTYNFIIREISTDGNVKTIAGKAGIAGSADGKTVQSRFNMPIGIAIDGTDYIYVVDADYDGNMPGNCTIRKINPKGVVTTLAGITGQTGCTDGKGSLATFNRPVGITVSKEGIIYIADTEGDIIRKITADGIVSTIGGKYLVEDNQDGKGNDARFNDPQAIAISDKGVLFIADTFNNRVVKGELIENEK